MFYDKERKTLSAEEVLWGYYSHDVFAFGSSREQISISSPPLASLTNDAESQHSLHLW